MSRDEHLLTCLMEECAEVAHRASKALRFGIGEVQPGQTQTNGVRLLDEVIDLVAVFEMCSHIRTADLNPLRIAQKKDKVEHFLGYAQQCGTLTVEKPKVGADG